MPDWIDELEQQKKREQQEYDAKMEGIYADIRQTSARQEALIESKRHLVDPVYAKLEIHIERAKQSGFYLWIRKNDYEYRLDIHRMEQDYPSDAKYRTSLAHVSLTPKSNGFQLAFTPSKVEFSFVKKEFESKSKWQEKGEYHTGIQLIGTVPYGSLTEDDLLNIVKWIATGIEPIPKFRNLIPYKSPIPEIKTRGCLMNPWYYLGCGALFLIFVLIGFLLWVTLSGQIQ